MTPLTVTRRFQRRGSIWQLRRDVGNVALQRRAVFAENPASVTIWSTFESEQNCRTMKSSVLGKRFFMLWFGLIFVMPLANGAPDPQDDAFGKALDARKGALVAPAHPAYSTLPLTIECRVKLLGKEQYNILVANETKASSTHWEIFTTPGDGTLHAYLPGRTPDHVHTNVPLVDGQWHWVAMVMEESRISLFVDRAEKASANS